MIVYKTLWQEICNLEAQDKFYTHQYENYKF